MKYERMVKMKIAVTYQDGMIFQHFGHSQQFKLYEVENGKVIKSKIVDTNGQGRGALLGFLTDCHADILICGGIGAGAQSALSESGIQIFGGVSGSADEAVQNYLSDTLQYVLAAQCNHREHGHSCQSHSCHEEKHGYSGNAFHE